MAVWAHVLVAVATPGRAAVGAVAWQRADRRAAAAAATWRRRAARFRSRRWPAEQTTPDHPGSRASAGRVLGELLASEWRHDEDAQMTQAALEAAAQLD